MGETMMPNTMLSDGPSDTDLVAASLSGNRDAFGQIVGRYQSLLCSIAYSATGSVTQSEDVAQETFLTAWRQLRQLREPAKLRPWLCQIARHRTFDALRRHKPAEPLDAADDSASLELSPPEQTISKEEEAILWRSVGQMPEIYREPLVLFYREAHSIQRVAESLDLTEDTVKQRLSRGRKMLHAEVLAFVEGTLERTTPREAFTQAVVGALPPSTGLSVAAAVAKGALAKGLIGGLGGMALIFFGNYAGYRTGMASAQSEAERKYIKGFYLKLVMLVAGFLVIFSALMFWGVKGGKGHPTLFFDLLLGVVALYVAGSIAMGASIWRQGRTAFSGSAKRSGPAWEYRSPQVFLGLPLVHIRVGGDSASNRQPVKAWIAAGSFAYGGLFAFGGIAIAPLSIGGCAIGIFSWGGMALGVVAMGGLSIGGWTFGGLALGWQAYGACAVAWNAASGAAALAHDYAIGNVARALQAGNATARAYLDSSAFFRAAEGFSHYAGWLNILWVAPMLWWWRVASRASRGVESQRL